MSFRLRDLMAWAMLESMKALPIAERTDSTVDGPMTGRAVTIYDVARRAGVSISTVSRCLRASAPVSDQTRRRVLRAVDELGFRPSHLGTSLARGQHAAGGVVVPDLTGPYYAEVLLGYEEAASRLGRSMLVLSTRNQNSPIKAVRELAGRVDGLVLLGRTVGDGELAQLGSDDVPIVHVARPPVPGADCLRTDNRSGAHALGTHLAKHRVTGAHFLGDPGASPDAAERWAGVSEKLADHGIPLEVVPCGFDVESGLRAAHAVLTELGPRLPSSRQPGLAFVCANDEIALGAIEATEHAGRSVGVDVAITGWDDVMAARHARPALTTVRQPMRSLGALAAEALDERIRGSRATARHELLPTELVVRRSCGCQP